MIDAPDPYKNKLVSAGEAVWVEDVQAYQAQTNNERSSGESPAPVSVVPKKRVSRKKVS